MRRIAVAVGLAALSIAVRLPAVWQTPFSQDEVASARILSEPTLVGAIRHVVRTESTPPLWYVLGWLVHHAGVPTVDVRLLSVAFSAALVLIVLRIAELLVPLGYAAAAAALVSLGSELVYHGAELRSYELLALLSSVLVALLASELHVPRRRVEAAIAVTVAAGLLTHYFFGYSLLAALAWLWLDPRARAIRVRATAAACTGAVAFTPWLPAFVAQYRHDRFWWIGRYSTKLVVATPLRLYSPLGVRHVVLAALALALAAVGAVAVTRRSPVGGLVTACAFVPLAAAAAVWASGERTYAVRNLIEIAPCLAVLAVTGVALIPRPAGTTVAAGAVVAAGAAWWAQTSLPPPPYRAIAHALIAAGWRPADPIAVHGNFFSIRAPLEWYLPRGPLLDVSTPTKTPCATVFVITHTNSRTYSVTRARPGARLKHVTILATARAGACVRLSENPHLKPLT